MIRTNTNSKKGFTLVELVVVVVILGILAAILVPIISSILETTNQATDNANARLVYNSAAAWFSENNSAKADLSASDLLQYLGLNDFPPARSNAFGGDFSISVTASGYITVATSKPSVFDPSSGKLKVP